MLIPGLIYSCVLLLPRKTGAHGRWDSWECSEVQWKVGTDKYDSSAPICQGHAIQNIVGVGGWDIRFSEKWQELPGARHSCWRAVKDTLRFLSKETCQVNILRKKRKAISPHISQERVWRRKWGFIWAYFITWSTFFFWLFCCCLQGGLELLTLSSLQKSENRIERDLGTSVGDRPRDRSDRAQRISRGPGAIYQT